MSNEPSELRARFHRSLPGSALDQAKRATAAAEQSLGVYPKGVVQYGVRNEVRPCVGIARISRDDPASLSIENQERDIREWAKADGRKCMAVFSDRDSSGRRSPLRRPESRKAIEMAEQLAGEGKKPILVCTRLDRLSRNSYNTLHLLRHLERRGIDLVFTRQSFDTTTPEGKIAAHAMMMVIEAEAAFSGKRRKDANDAPRLVGARLNSTCPLGFKLTEDNFLIEDHDNWQIIRDIERLLIETPPSEFKSTGVPWGEITSTINGLGYRTPRGNKWLRQSLCRAWDSHKRNRRRIDELRRQGHPVYVNTAPPE